MTGSNQSQTLLSGATKSKVSEPLTVKQLAASIGVSPRFVYQMRLCGFPMSGDTHNRQMATLEEARAWIKANNFRLIKSVGVTGLSAPLLLVNNP